MEEELPLSQALNLAVEKHNAGKLEEAEVIYKKILAKNPNISNAWQLLGVVAHQRGNHEEAARLIQKAIQLNPSAIYYGNLGMVYDALEKEEESAACYEKALEINPQYPGAKLAYYNLGIFYKEKEELTRALSLYEKAIALDNNFAEAHWNRGLLLLLLGKLEEGWSEYEYRFKKTSPTDSRKFNKPKWEGEPLENKRILLISEQGFGDSIQFIRYAPLVKEKGGYVILECKKELKRLFENSPCIDKIIEKGNSISDIYYDFYAHLLSLPAIFKTSLENIPFKKPYLKADPFLINKFKEKIFSNNLKVGIVWAGNPKQEEDKERSLTFEKFRFLSNIPEIKVFSMQKGGAAKQLNDPSIINLENEITDFADTAAIIVNLDLIIATDTAVAHLAGAVGKPAWVLLKKIPDWRWLLGGKDSPWYSSIKLFRQEKSRNWETVFEEIRKELLAKIKTKR